MKYTAYENFKAFMHDAGCARTFILTDNSINNTEKVIIREVIELPHDILLGVSTVIGNKYQIESGYKTSRLQVSEDITYYRLSEIRLSYKKEV